MARLWVRGGSGDWAILPLEASMGFYSLVTIPPRVLGALPDDRREDCSAVLAAEECPGPGRDPGDVNWFILSASPRGVAVNGIPLLTGVHFLCDGDEIRVEGRGTYYFSAEREARPQEFRADEHPSGSVHCPRCQRPIANGETCVRCPRCGVLYHHLPDDGYPCWTYADRCSICGNATEIGGGPEWTPDGL